MLQNHRVVELIVRERRLRWPIPDHLESTLRDQIVRKVTRRAKYLLLRFDHGTLIVHLGMSGSLRILPPDTVPKIHDHWELRLDTKKILRYHDPRRFGSALWTTGDPHAHPLLIKLAPEPLSQAFDAQYLHRTTRKRNITIKQLIMNSHHVVGVGNIYASESLFRAKIAPRRIAKRITRAQALILTATIKAVLAEAIKIGGTTLRDYVNAEGIPGYFSQKLFVYDRADQACRVCRTPIKQFVQGQRSTYWCPTCQK